MINVIWRLTLRRMLAESFELKLLCKKRCFYRRIKIYITYLCKTFDRPQLSGSEGCCVFIGHEYIYSHSPLLIHEEMLAVT